MNKLILLLCALLLAGLLPGCAGADNTLRGKWYDLNGDTVLEVGRSRLSLSWGSYKDSYPFTAETEGGTTVLKGTKENYGCFGPVSALTLREDGSLAGYEMVLDGDGHLYRFVRKEALEALREIVDRSADLPKEITSREIKTFRLSFRNDGSSYGLEGWPAGTYFWEIEPGEEGRWQLSLRASGSSYIALDAAGEVGEDWMLGLDARIRELEIPRYNGYRFLNEVDRTGWSLRVEYASGEKLSLSAEGDAAETCPFDLPGLMAYVRPMAEEQLR